MVERGTHVIFIVVGGRFEIPMPPDYVIAHDQLGEYGRSCDVYILPVRGLASLRDVDRRDLAAAERRYGSSALTAGWVEPPDHSWSRLERVERILYHSLGQDWQHPYVPPVWLFEHRSQPAWKVALPDGCVLNERGFVYP